MGYDTPASLTTVVLDLNYLGNIGDNEKYFFGDRNYIKNNNYFSRFKRYWQCENLQSQLKSITNIINNAYICFDQYADNMYYGHLLESFKKAREGLIRVKNTYCMEQGNFDGLDLILYGMDKKIQDLESGC